MAQLRTALHAMNGMADRLRSVTAAGARSSDRCGASCFDMKQSLVKPATRGGHDACTPI